MAIQHISKGDTITAGYLNQLAAMAQGQTNYTDSQFIETPNGSVQYQSAAPEQFISNGSTLLDVCWGPATKNVVCYGETDDNRWKYRHLWINLGQSLADFCQIATINMPRICVNGVFAAGWNNGIDSAPDAIKLTEASFALNDAEDDKEVYDTLDVLDIRTSASKVKYNYTGWVELPINTLSVYPYNDAENMFDTFAQNGVWMHFFAKFNQGDGEGGYYSYVPNVYICFSNTRTIYSQSFADELIADDVHATNIRETDYPPIKIASLKLVNKMVPGTKTQQGEDPNKYKTKNQQLIQITKGFPMLNQFQEMIGQVRVKFSGAGANLSATAWVVMPQDNGAVTINLESGKQLFAFSPSFCVNGTPIYFPIDRYVHPSGSVVDAETGSGLPGPPEMFAYGLLGNQKSWLTFCSNQSWSSLGGSLFTKAIYNDPLGVSKKAYVGGTIWAIPKWNAEFNKWTLWFEIKGMSSYGVETTPSRPEQSNDSIAKPMPICVGSFIVPAEEAVETTINVANISQLLLGIGSVFTTTTTDAYYGRRSGGYESIDLCADVCKSLEYELTHVGSHFVNWLQPETDIELDQTLQLYGFRYPRFVPDETIKANLSADEAQVLSSLAFIMRNQVTTDGQEGKDVEVNYMDLSAFWRCISSDISAASDLYGDTEHFNLTTLGPHSITRPTLSGELADFLMLYDFYDNAHNIDISSIVPDLDNRSEYDNNKWQILVREWTDDEDPGGSFLKYASLSSWPLAEPDGNIDDIARSINRNSEKQIQIYDFEDAQPSEYLSSDLVVVRRPGTETSLPEVKYIPASQFGGGGGGSSYKGDANAGINQNSINLVSADSYFELYDFASPLPFEALSSDMAVVRHVSDGETPTPEVKYVELSTLMPRNYIAGDDTNIVFTPVPGTLDIAVDVYYK